MNKSLKKKVLLLGEGVHQHTLYGSFVMESEKTDNFFTDINVKEDSLLKHEHPNGSFGEHNTLKITKGNWIMGKQVEYNPFDKKVTRVWD